MRARMSTRGRGGCEVMAEARAGGVRSLHALAGRGAAKVKLSVRHVRWTHDRWSAERELMRDRDKVG